MPASKEKLTLEQMQKSLSDINKRLGYKERDLSESPTAYSDEEDPEMSDVATEINIRKLKRQRDVLESQLKQAEWYGKSKAPEETGGKRHESILEKGLGVLSTPLHAIVGGVQGLTGTGSVPGWQNVYKNIEEGEGFGSILRKKGVPEYANIPLGFMLDVAFDPVNWATVGTGALIPRIGTGLVKGGAKGALKGAESSFLEKASTLSRMLPGQERLDTVVKGLEKEGKKLGQLTDEERKAVGLTKFREKIAQMQERTIKSKEDFDAVIGHNLEKILDERGALTDEKTGEWAKLRKVYLGAGDIMRENIEKMPGGRTFLTAFDYNPSTWFRQAMLADKLKRLNEKKISRYKEKRDPVTGEVLESNIEEVKETIKEIGRDSGNFKRESTESLDDAYPKGPLGKRMEDAPKKRIKEIIDEGAEAANAPESVTRLPDTILDAQRMLGEAKIDYEWKDLIKIYQDKALKAAGEFDPNATGLKWWDEKMKVLKEIKTKNGTPWVKNTLDAFHGFIDTFKSVKVNALSPSAVVNASAGNPAMAAMMGFNITRGSYFSTVKDAFHFLTGKGIKFINKYLLERPDIIQFVKGHENTFGRIIGLGPDSFNDSVILYAAKQEARKLGIKSDPDIVMKQLKQIQDKMKSTPLQTYGKKIKEGTMTAEEIPTSFSAEMYGNSEYFLKMKNWAAENSGTNMAARAIDVIINKGVSGYERIDQSFKLGGFIHAVVNGLDEGEIRKISRFVKMGRDDILEKSKSGGRYLYKISPEKALEIVNTAYMNYAAMPAAVKILRSLPILGSPFASFSYGMGMKAAETALYNPAIFNKVNYLMDEISGPKTPLEKEAMLKGYYKNFGQPGMMKLPFSRENPIYLNVANMIPYLSFNMFQENGRKYSDQFPSRMVEMIDSSPLLKDPVGQVIFDYFIQPMILQGEQPQNVFGTPIYPVTATPLEKTGYALRQLGEAVTPSAPMAIAGAVAGLTPLPEQAIEATPSYRFRQLARSVRGKDVLGFKRKEHPASRTFRAGFSTAGFPISQMDLDFMASNLSKKKKK